MENQLEQQIEKLYSEIEQSIIAKPVNDVQEGFNIALQCLHSKLSFILGKSKTYTFDELMEVLKK